MTTTPGARGLYDPAYEHDACGVAFVARLRAPASHEVVVRALRALDHLEHRGAEGADPFTGDGAGILVQLPDELLRAEAGFELPPAGRYGVAMCFLPQDDAARDEAIKLLERSTTDEGQRVLGWRDVPIDEDSCGRTARACMPHIAQLFVGAADDVADQDALERKLYVIRRVVEQAGLAGLADPQLLVAHARLQGHADGAAAAVLLPRPQGRAHGQPPGARALALLDEHLPELGAGASLPDARPQRRDQHAARQQKLDESA